MKNARRPLRLPADFRQTVVLMNLNPSIVLQRYIDLMQFFPVFSKLELDEKIKKGDKILAMMYRHQRIGKKKIDAILWKYNTTYLKCLIHLSEDKTLTDKEKNKRSSAMIKKWEKETAHLLNYPREILLEDGSKLALTFNFILVYMSIFIPLRRGLSDFMRRISITMLFAHRYSSKDYRNEICLDFVDMLNRQKRGRNIDISPAQLILRKAFNTKMHQMIKITTHLKSYRKRVIVFRALVKEWYDKMLVIYESATSPRP